MIARRARLAVVPVLVSSLLAPVAVSAQTPPPPTDSSPDGRKSGTYFKPGVAYWQGDIFSESSLTSWNVDLFGAHYDLTSLSLEIESYFRRSFVVSGLSIGYRKDDLRSAASGHMFSGTLFHDFDLKAIGIKAGGGVEWGAPSVTFDQTEFDYAADGTVRYRHTYPGRNSDLPVGPRHNGAVYPFMVFSVVQRPGPVLFEVGMRINMIKFHFDDYEVRPGDQVTRGFSERRVMAPYLFASFGLRMF